MNKTPDTKPNDEMETWEMRVQQEARQFNYPPTPDIARQVRQKLRQPVRPTASFRLARAAMLIVTILVALIAFPPTRAVMVEIIRIGAVRLLPYPPSPTPTAEPSETPAPNATVSRTPRPTITPLPTPLMSALDLPGETTLAEAQKRVKFKILLPTYPEGIGQPDRVFFMTDPLIVTMVWTEAPGSDRVKMVLAVIGENSFVGKFYPWNESRVKVNGQDAVWLTEPHELYQEMPGRNELAIERRMVQDYVLVWVSNRLTYRLETDMSLQEAIKVAETVKE